MRIFVLLFLTTVSLTGCGLIDLNKDLKNPTNTQNQTSAESSKFNNGLDVPTKPKISCLKCKDESEKVATISPNTLYTVLLRESRDRVVWHLYNGSNYYGSVAVKYATGTTVDWDITPGNYVNMTFTSGNKITMTKSGTQTFGANRPKATFSF